MKENMGSSITLDFALVGAQKAATTKIIKELERGGMVRLPRNPDRELHLFDRDKYFNSDRLNESGKAHLMHNYGQGGAPYRLNGDKTPIYMFLDKALRRLRHYNPRIKLIACLREPVSRAYSQWRMEYARAKEDRPFSEAVAHEVSTFLFRSKHPVFSYFYRGFYSHQIEVLFDLFPAKQVLILNYDELRGAPDVFFARIAEFLGVPPWVSDVSPVMPAIQQRPGSLPFSNPYHAIDKDLSHALMEDITRVEGQTGLRLDRWKHPLASRI